MTLTVVVGSSGSGKTTFLNDVHKSHKCIYIRQYHNMRPYICASRIPNFDPTRLPYWDIYQREGTAEAIKVGGTMAGQFTAGLSGGQRKLLLFELICQRTAGQSELLIVLDEPFAGVTDDFVPFIVERLNEMRKKHNVLLVTNDHVETLTSVADNTITVSAIDRTKVQINKDRYYDREKVIVALSVGNEYRYKASSADWKFFFDVELASNTDLVGIAAFSVFSFSLFLATFWDSSEDSAALILVAGSLVAFFCINPYLLSLVEWRNAMNEEAEALVHASKGMNKALKTMLTLVLIVILSIIEFGIVNAVVDGFSSAEYWIAMFVDSASMTFPFIGLGLYTALPFQTTDVLSVMPFTLMIFLSTTFSPGSGVAGLKELRYLFTRFYFWCIVPSVQDDMEGCLESRGLNLLFMILSGMLGLFLFLVWLVIAKMIKSRDAAMAKSKQSKMVDDEFKQLQATMYGRKQGADISVRISAPSMSSRDGDTESDGLGLSQHRSGGEESV